MRPKPGRRNLQNWGLAACLTFTLMHVAGSPAAVQMMDIGNVCACEWRGFWRGVTRVAGALRDFEPRAEVGALSCRGR